MTSTSTSTSTPPTTDALMPLPTHKTCGVCSESLPRHLFQKKEYRRTDRSPTCHDCKRAMTANRIKQKPPSSQRTVQGRVAESGMVRRPNNFGHCDYIDMLFGMNCFPDLVSLRVFKSAKDVSESMAVLQGVARHGNFNFEEEEDDNNNNNNNNRHQKTKTGKSKSNVLCLCIGDGCTPRTAVLACFLQGWTCVSIDPALNEEWSGSNPKDVVGLTGYRGTLAQFFDETDPSLIRPSSSSSSKPYQHLILLCVHSHARFIGSVTISQIRNCYDNVATTICSLPCCPKFRHKGDIGREPDISYDDDCVFSAMRKVEIWKIEQGCDDVDTILCGEVADSSASSMDHLALDSPADLNPDVVADMLRSCPLFSERLTHSSGGGENDLLIRSISVDEIEEGVLSHVVRVNIEYAPPLSNDLMPDSLVIKFLRPDAPQHRMFLTEGAFYSSANDVLRRDVVPFQISRAIYLSSNCIVLERIAGRSFKLVDGCQDLNDAESCIKLLATTHARSWVGCSSDDNDDKKPKYFDLDSCPGVGLALDGLAKERRFVSQHAKYLDLYASSASEENVIMDENAQSRLRSLSEKLCHHRLREIHDRVVSYRPCLIHGDFHVGNLIFPSKGGNPPPALIDWATCGRGNPIFDVVFFLLVSTPEGGEDEDYTTNLLNLYYRTLLDSNTSENSDLIRRDFSSHDGSFLSMYTNVVLNEFLILIAYDELSREFVEAAEKPAMRAERGRHFRNVARRSMTALLNIESTIDWPSLKSEEEIKEEKIALEDGGGDIKVAL